MNHQLLRTRRLPLGKIIGRFGPHPQALRANAFPLGGKGRRHVQRFPAGVARDDSPFPAIGIGIQHFVPDAFPSQTRPANPEIVAGDHFERHRLVGQDDPVILQPAEPDLGREILQRPDPKHLRLLARESELVLPSQ